jgi:hypothetical protein
MVVDFPAPFGPRNPTTCPTIYLEGDLIDGGDAAEALGDAVEGE